MLAWPGSARGNGRPVVSAASCWVWPAGCTSTSRPPGLSIILSLAWIVGGLIAFLGWARLNDSWPFAPVRVEEAYLELQDSTGDPDVAQAPV